MSDVKGDLSAFHKRTLIHPNWTAVIKYWKTLVERRVAARRHQRYPRREASRSARGQSCGRDINLSQEELAMLGAASALDPKYPGWMMK